MVCGRSQYSPLYVRVGNHKAQPCICQIASFFQLVSPNGAVVLGVMLLSGLMCACTPVQSCNSCFSGYRSAPDHDGRQMAVDKSIAMPESGTADGARCHLGRIGGWWALAQDMGT